MCEHSETNIDFKIVDAEVNTAKKIDTELLFKSDDFEMKQRGNATQGFSHYYETELEWKSHDVHFFICS